MNVNGILKALKNFFKYKVLLTQFGYKSIEDIKNYQFNELRRIIDYAWENIPFYRSLWEKSGFNPSKFQNINDLSKIPFIDKNVVREHYNEMVPVKYNRRKLSLATTGGTTGMPMKFYLNEYMARGKEVAFLYWTHKKWGYRMWLDRVAIMRGYRIGQNLIDKKIFWKNSRRERGLIFSSFHIDNDNYQIYLNKLRTYKPKFIKAYPSSIVAFCSLMKEHHDFGIEGLNAVICSSENIYDWQRNLVKETLNVEILSWYGHSEKIISAYQGRDGKMLFNPLYGYVEFLDENNNIVSDDGAVAQLVATSFDNRAFPFIRYKVYDYVEVGKSNDSGYTHVANRIIGREQEFVYDCNNNKVIFTCSDEPLWDIPGIIAYQYEQREKGVLELHLQCNDSFVKDTSLKLIKERAKEVFVNFQIEISFVDLIERTKNGKFRYLIQYIK